MVCGGRATIGEAYARDLRKRENAADSRMRQESVGSKFNERTGND